MASKSPIPVVILSGFLGAGKSTLINDLLAAPEMKDTAIVVNEFGDIGIDHELIRVSQREMMVTTLGCICCTAGSDIRTSLYELHEAAARDGRLAFSRVIVETTGLADPAPLINQLVPGYAPASGLRDHVVARRFRLAGFICAVDATAAQETLDHHFECLKQIAFADRLVLTKADLRNRDRDLARLVATLRELNPAADIVDRRHADFDIVSLFHPRGYVTTDRGEDVEGWLALERVLAAEPTEHGAGPRERHGGGIASFTLTYDTPIRPGDLADFLEALGVIAGARLLRLKGLVCVATDPECPFVIHGVQHNIHPPQRLDAWPSDDRRTRMVLITNGLDRNAVDQLFGAITNNKNNRRTRRKMIVIAASFVVLIAAGVLLSICSLARVGLAAPLGVAPFSGALHTATKDTP